MEALDQAQNGTVSHDAENQAQRPRSVDTHVLSSRRFCHGILTGERSTVPEIVHYESRCLLSPVGFLRI